MKKSVFGINLGTMHSLIAARYSERVEHINNALGSAYTRINKRFNTSKQQFILRQFFARKSAISVVAALIVSLFTCCSSFAQRTSDSSTAQLAVLRAFLDLPESQMDLAKIKVTVDKMIDRSTDESSTLKRLDEIASRVRAMFPVTASSRQKFEALRSFLYEPGPWNQYEIYKYDLEGDPLGTAIRGKLMANYLSTRKGNCVSMPILFVIIGQKLEIDVTLSSAPEHYFVKYRDETGKYTSAEATHDGGPKADASYIRDFEITPLSIKNSLYLQPLTQRENAVQIIGTLTEYYSQTKNIAKLHSTVDLLSRYDPRRPALIARKGYAYYLEIEARFIDKFPDKSTLSDAQRKEYDRIAAVSRSWYEKAEALGWRQPSKKLIASQKALARDAASDQKTKGTR
jgi:regulator of sirC expression with transglutaminase-like and TPR domain